MGISIRILAKSRDKYASSLPLKSFVFCAPFISSIFLYILSRFSYFCKSFTAVFSPIPFTPGILSDVSPINAFMSII